MVAGTATGLITHVQRAARWVPTVERWSGILLLVAALYFVYQSAAYAGLVTPFQFLFG